MGLEWDGHELLSLDIVGKSKWVDLYPAVGFLKWTGERSGMWYNIEKEEGRYHDH